MPPKEKLGAQATLNEFRVAAGGDKNVISDDEVKQAIQEKHAQDAIDPDDARILRTVGEATQRTIFLGFSFSPLSGLD